MPAVFEPVLARLAQEAETHFGSADARLLPVRHEDRPYSFLLRVRVRVPGRPDSHVFVKRFKPKPHDGGVGKMRVRVAHEFATTRHIHDEMARWPDLAAVCPIACYPDDLAIVTREAPGVTLLADLRRRAAWFPGPATMRSLEATLHRVGRWVRAFQGIDPGSAEVPVSALREYVDLRLTRLAGRGVVDAKDRTRILDHLERLGRGAPASDLREVMAHADLAPANILVSDGRVVVLDFAMAGRAGTLHDVSRLFLQLDLLAAKPQFRAAVVRRLQGALLEGFQPGLTPERPVFRLLLMLHRVNHLGTLAAAREALPARAFSGHIRRLHRRWIERELRAGVSGVAG